MVPPLAAAVAVGVDTVLPVFVLVVVLEVVPEVVLVEELGVALTAITAGGAIVILIAV